MNRLAVFVRGRPAPQGSKTYLGRGRMMESSRFVKGWREDVRAGVLAAWGNTPPLLGPIALQLKFVMPRPTSAPKRRTPPAVKRPDLDKLVRAVFDALGSAGIFKDDSQVTFLQASKRIAEMDEATGVDIKLLETRDNV